MPHRPPPSTSQGSSAPVSVLACSKQDLDPGYLSTCVRPTSPRPTVRKLISIFAALFYTKEEMGMRMAYWFGFAAVAGAFGGLIAFGVQHIHAHIENWRILFLIEGTPTIVLGILTMFLLPNRPEETSIFNEEERELAIARMNRGISGDLGRMVNKSASPIHTLPRGRTAVGDTA